MKQSVRILIVLALALLSAACYLPGISPSGSQKQTAVPIIENTATATATITAQPSSTHTQTAPTATATPTATVTSAGSIVHVDVPCTYRVTFISDVTIPDDTVMTAGSTFVKTWLVRNDGSCAWGPDGYALHALAFTGGSQMGAPAVIPLHANVAPGQTVDVSVTLTAPPAPGTYISSWMFRLNNDPNGAGLNLGVGPNGDQPLYARIQVSGGGSGLARLQFQPGTTSAIVTGDLGANETRGYLVAAQQGQVIIADTSLQDQESGVRVKITTKDNATLPDLLPNLSVAASLPATQDYIVWVTGGSHAVSYHLAVTVPIRISFAPGGVSASLDGSISGGDAIWYVLRASAGQTLTASLEGPNVSLVVAGLENPEVLVSSVTSWTGTLPVTQDYILQIMPSAQPAPYTLNVTVE